MNAYQRVIELLREMRAERVWAAEPEGTFASGWRLGAWRAVLTSSASGELNLFELSRSGSSARPDLFLDALTDVLLERAQAAERAAPAA
ncbi:MAG: hypothetical protein H7Y88_09645 [Phycisphaerales bacterium]|nr:hypothetical protein [Phycisphaerales bacterium]